MSDYTVIHHDDLDGKCAGAIINLAFTDREGLFIQVNYKDDFPFDRIKKNSEVHIVDFSLQQPGEWERLLSITTNVTWIDHHETAIKKAIGTGAENLRGIRDTTACGALLAWRYYFPKSAEPNVIHLVDKWDRWVHKEDPLVLNFVAGQESYDFGPQHLTWKRLLLDIDSAQWINELQKEGAAILRYEKARSQRYISTFGHEITWQGYRCLVTNIGKVNSGFFGNSLKQFDICLAIIWDGRVWTISMYSETVKVNDIAMEHGGGGHPTAAGFRCAALPWTQGGGE